MTVSSWQDAARKAQEHRDKTLSQIEPAIPDVPSQLPEDVTDLPNQLLSSRELEITSKPTEELLSSLATGELSSTEVTHAYLRRAGLAQKLTNCVTELLTTTALTRAKQLDQHLEEFKKPIGPLHGLPISVKEHVGMKGLTHSACVVVWADQTAEDDAHLLKILWNAGCVFHVRTTEPALLMELETRSNLYGVTVNPYNGALTCGGSSGGEASLIGLRGSHLGVGSDIGGSIRVPAAYQGLYGLRPTTRRIPSTGIMAARGGSGYIDPTLGPISTTLGGVKLFMETVLGSKPWTQDPSLVPLPWCKDAHHLREKDGVKQLKVAVMWHDGTVRPLPPVHRALSEVIEKLKAVPGVTVVEWKPYKHDFALEMMVKLILMDGGVQTSELLEATGEPVDNLLEMVLKTTADLKHRPVAEIEELKMKKDTYSLEYFQKWKFEGKTSKSEGDNDATDEVDVILCPVSPGPALPHGTSIYWGYSSQWNVLDYPGIVFPVTKVDQTLDKRDVSYQPSNDTDRHIYDLYEGPEKFENAPVSLQLVARKYEDERLVEALEYITRKISLPFV